MLKLTNAQFIAVVRDAVTTGMTLQKSSKGTPKPDEVERVVHQAAQESAQSVCGRRL